MSESPDPCEASMSLTCPPGHSPRVEPTDLAAAIPNRRLPTDLPGMSARATACDPTDKPSFHRSPVGREYAAAAEEVQAPVAVPFRTQHPLGAVVNRPSVWSDR